MLKSCHISEVFHCVSATLLIIAPDLAESLLNTVILKLEQSKRF